MKFDLKKYVIGNFKIRGLFLLFQILLTIILPLSLAPQKFGEISLVFTNANFALLITSLGLPSALSFYASKKPEHHSQLLQILFGASLIQLLFVSLIEWGYRHFTDVFLIWPTHSIIFGIIGIIWYWSIFINEQLTALFNGLLKIVVYYRICSISIGAQVLLISSIHYLRWWKDPYAPIYIVISATFLQGIITCIWFYFSNSPKEKEPIDKMYLNYAISAYIANLIQFLATKSDIWIINHYQSKTAVGYYAFASKLGQFFLVIPVMLAAIVFPLFAAQKINIGALERLIRIMNGLLLFVGFTACLLAKWIIPFIWQNQYDGSITSFFFIIPGFIAQAQVTIYAAYYAGLSKIKINIFISIITLTLMLMSNSILLPNYGIEGAALGFSIANIGSAGVMIYLFNKTNGLRSIRILPLWKDLKFLHAIFINEKR